jgi:hypothetical protein
MTGGRPAKETKTESEISAQAKAVLSRKEAVARVPAKAPVGYLVVNNSFLHRARAQFRKGGQYLAITVDAKGAPAFNNPVLIGGLIKIADFDFIPRSNPRVTATPLSTEVPTLLASFGSLAFVMLGEVLSGGRFEEPIQSKALTTLVLDPSEPNEITVRPPLILLNRLVDADRVWDHIQSVGADGWELESSFGSHLSTAVHEALGNETIRISAIRVTAR